MPDKKSAVAVATLSWWLTDGDEECPHCGRLYLYEVEFRALNATAGCPHCRVVHEEGRLICPGCVPESRGSRQHARG